LLSATRCAILVVAHLNKAMGANPLYRVGGSIGLTGAARSVMLFGRDPHDPEGERGRSRILAQVARTTASSSRPAAIESSRRCSPPPTAFPRSRQIGRAHV